MRGHVRLKKNQKAPKAYRRSAVLVGMSNNKITFRDVTETLSGRVLEESGEYLRVSSCRGILWVHISDVIRIG